MMKAKKESFLPNSNTIYFRRDANGKREDYFTQILCTRDGQNHNVALGDICAILDNDEGVKEAPWKDKQTVIGQVLALFVRRESIDQSTFLVKVRRLARWKEEASNFGTNKAMKKFQKSCVFRPDQALCETMKVEIYSLSDVLRADIQIVDSNQFLTSDKLRADFDQDTDSHTIFRCCPARVDDCDEFHDVRADWNKYEDRRSSSKSSRTNKPPSALERGWQLLKDNQLLRALLGTWNIRTDQVFSTKKAVTGKEKKRAAEQASLQSSTKRSKKNKSNKNSRSVTFAVGSKPGRTTKRARENDETTTYYSADSITAQDSVTMDETSTEASNEAFMEESPDEISLHAMPFGKPVYQTHARSTSGTTFLEGVEMDVDDQAQACKIGRSRGKQKRWHYRVGDILMIRCKDTSPPQKPFVAGKSMWYPFNVPWSVVQVVAIYRYKDESAMKMQVRWFYRPDELGPNVHENLKNEQKMEFKGRFQSRVLVEVDEHIDEVEVESALGHAKLTSEPSPSKEWFCPDFTAAVPQMGFLCRYMHLVKDDDPILYPINDWTNYGVSSSPLFRGLHCPKGKPGRSPKLRKRYEERLCHAFGIEQLTESHIGEEKQTEEISVVGWSPEEVDSAQALCQTTHFCYGSKQNNYYSCASVRLVKERCDARGMAKKSEHQEVQVSIGDFVCITSSFDEAARQGGTKETKNAWFPFRGPYVVVQVLSIYQQSTKRTPQVLLEVRRFYRRGEIRHVSAECLPENCAKNGEEEVFESFDVEIVPAGRVLGLALVFLGYHNEEYRIKAANTSSHTSGLFRPKYRCKFFATQICVQQLFCADSTASKWSRRMLERGLRASKMIGSDAELATVIEFGLGVSLSEAQAGKSSLFQSLIDETKKFPAVRPLFKKTMEAGETSFYSHVCIGIPWSNFVDKHYLCSHRDRNDCWWKVCVGGVVAIKTEGLTPNPYYNCNWEPAQILAIQSFDSAESGGSQKYRFSVRWLRRSGKVALLNSFPGRLRESESHSNCIVSSDDLLGPIYVTSEGSIGSIWDIIVPYLPSNVMIYESENVFDVTLFAAKSLRISGLYSGAELDSLFNALDDELPGFVNLHLMQASPCESLSSGTSEPVLIEPTPLGHMYTDASGTDYYCRVKLEPSINNYAEELREGRHRIDGPWTVEVGDVVGVKYTHGNGRAKYGLHSFLKTSTNWPATSPWAISEISAVLVKKLPSRTERSVELEVRWYYRAPEIKGGTKLTAEAAKNCCEELFESDHYDIIPASAVMFPTKIHEKAITLGKHSFHLGMPVVEFFCYRFWSPHRKSLVPLESSEEARMKRARQYSPLFQHDAGLRDAVATKFGLVMDSSIRINKGWRSSFQDVIQKLSLTDASKEGFKSSKAIVGRDKEMKHILSFLQTALSGSSKEGHRSLFIAGPVSILLSISFDFLSPFDLYSNY